MARSKDYERVREDEGLSRYPLVYMVLGRDDVGNPEFEVWTKNPKFMKALMEQYSPLREIAS
jgi:hypothetical protein